MGTHLVKLEYEGGLRDFELKKPTDAEFSEYFEKLAEFDDATKGGENNLRKGQELFRWRKERLAEHLRKAPFLQDGEKCTLETLANQDADLVGKLLNEYEKFYKTQLNVEK